MKKRLTNYNFWISMISAVLLILQAFNIEFDIAYFNEIATAVLGLLVVIGIVSDPTKISVKSDTETTSTKTSTETVKETEKAEETAIKDIIEDKVALASIPTESKDAIADDTVQDDFKTFVTKVEEDIQAEKEKLSTLKTEMFEALKVALSSVEQIKETAIPNEAEPIAETPEQTNSFNIVNQ